MWYASMEFYTKPLLARDAEIKKLESALGGGEDFFINAKINELKAIPEENVSTCSVCGKVYNNNLSYSVCSDSCYRDKFL